MHTPQPGPLVTSESTTRRSAPRTPRPKPPRDEEAEHLLRLCREGRLFELQAWVTGGKPLTVPPHYHQTPLRVALDTGFHSLIEFLLQHETDQSVKDDALRQACWRGEESAMQLVLTHGAHASAIPFQDVIETWNRDVVQLFVARGADLVTGAPFARAVKKRIKAVLGIFLDCKRARPDCGDALQEQADMALRQACQDDDLKWVSLLMWLGANPRSRGLTTDDLDSSYPLEDSDRQSALQIACGSKKPEILRRLKPDPAVDDLRELMASAASWNTTPETVAFLVRLGASVNDKADGGSTVLEKCLENFGWKEAVWDRWQHRGTVPLSQLESSIAALRSVLEKGARWTPNERSIGETRRALYLVDGDAIVAVVELLRTHQACDAAVLTALLKTEKMRRIMASVAHARHAAERRAQPTRSTRQRQSGRPPTVAGAPVRLPPSRYNRARLYEEVWTEPTQAVAARYGVSDAASAKACAVLHIPKPPRGYWAKRAAGHTVPARPPLPTHDS